MIEFQKEKHSDKEIFSSLNPLFSAWFKWKFNSFSEPQKYAMLNIHNNKNTLISAPTGSGKTLSAFGAIISELLNLNERKELENRIYCVYISPLKALNNDIEKNLLEPLEEIKEAGKKQGKKIDVRVGVRTGDTTQSERSKMFRKPPHILITTPESIAIVLNSPKFKNYLKKVQWMIVDEIHSLAENKRGVHLSLSMERIQELSPNLTRIGLSATVSPLEEIAKYLVGNENKKERRCKMVDVQFLKKLDLKVVSPIKNFMNTSQEAIHRNLYDKLHNMIQSHKTTLIFTNTRSATERVVHNLKEKYPEFYTSNIGAHHSSLSRDHRLRIENRLKEGQLKVVVSSTSLELGIDIGFIDLVVLLSSPKSVARALQRCLPGNSLILTSSGKYIPIKKIVDQKLDVEVVSYNEKEGFIFNEISEYHKNNEIKLIKFKLRCGEDLTTTPNHPILTNNGWMEAKNITLDDKIGEINSEIKFDHKDFYLYELLPKDKIFIENRENFFKKTIDSFLKKNKLTLKQFAEKYNLEYYKLIDCRRVIGRKKSISLDLFLKACDICKVPEKQYIKHLKFLKTKGNFRKKLPLKITEDLMWLAGVVATDGCIVRTKTKKSFYFCIKIGNTSKKLINKCKQIFKKFGFDCYFSIRDNGLYTLECGSNLFAYLLFSLGLKYKNKTRDIEVGKPIFQMSPELIYAYIEGVFEGDGNFSKQKNGAMLRIFTASKKFAFGLHYLLTRMGYHNNISGSFAEKSKKIKKTDCYLYTLVLTGQNNLKKLFKRFPKYGDKSKKSFKITEKMKFTPFKLKQFDKHIHWEDIVSIDHVKNKEPVYNLTLKKEPNNFIVGNMIVHNCGRAGHKLSDTVKGRLVVMDRDDLVECSVLLKDAIEKKIDRIQIPENPLDVLAQQIFGIAIGGPLHINEIYNLVKSSYCYRDLDRADFNDIISYLSGEFSSLENRHIYAKIWHDEETGMVGKKGKLARVLYMTNIGTIPDEARVAVKIGQHKIGSVDEGFAERLKKGDVFVLGGESYLFKYSRGMTIQVQAVYKKPPTVPSWFSEMLPLSYDLAVSIGKFRSLMDEKFALKKSRKEIIEFILKYLYVDDNAANAIYEYFREQFLYSKIPTKNRIVIEHYSDGSKKYLIFHSLFGRRVNDALSRAYGFALSKFLRKDIEITINDNGFMLACYSKMPTEKLLKAVKSKELRVLLGYAIKDSEIFLRRFRHCATRALMILRSYKGRTKTVGRQQMSARLLYYALLRISNNFPILKETRREILEDSMDIKNAIEVLEGIEKGKIKMEEVTSSSPSPFAFNLFAQGLSDIMKIEERLEFIKRMHERVMDKIGWMKQHEKGKWN